MQRKTFVEKHSDPDDDRAGVVLLASRAPAVLARLPRGYAAVVDVLSSEDQTALLAIVSRSILALQRQGRIAPRRMCQTCRYFAADAHPGSARKHHCRFVDAPLGEPALRIDCSEHEAIIIP